MSRKAEIDTRAPFRSVKEAVSLFGDKVVAAQLYATNNLKHQILNESNENNNGLEALKQGAVEAELEETRQNLQRAKEETMSMVHCLSSLQEELERTKQELEQLKRREEMEKKKKNRPIVEEESEIDEEVKFVENSTEFEVKDYFQTKEEDQKMNNEFQKKRYVTFANGPYAAQVIMPPSPHGVEKLERHSSLVNEKKKKKKPLIPLIGDIFSRKKGQN